MIDSLHLQCPTLRHMMASGTPCQHSTNSTAPEHSDNAGHISTHGPAGHATHLELLWVEIIELDLSLLQPPAGIAVLLFQHRHNGGHIL